MVLMTTSFPSEAKKVEVNTTDEFIRKSMVDAEGKGYLGKVKNPDYKVKEEIKIEEPKKKPQKKRYLKNGIRN